VPLQTTGNIVLTLDTLSDKTRVVSLDRIIETGYITFAAIGTITLNIGLLRIHADLRLLRTEGLTEYFAATIVQGYIQAPHIPMFTGRIPIMVGDTLRFSAIADIATSLIATIRFEREA